MRAPALFDPDRRPWVRFALPDTDKLREVVSACPSGALNLEIDGQARDWMRSKTIEKKRPAAGKNLPMETGYWAEAQSPQEYVLCRCGQSANKPFCDGTHIKVAWGEA